MEARKITVVSTANQSKKVIMSGAETLAELKADLRTNGIDYEGMTFFEGTAKVELKDDNSVLPHDVPYKGQTTNELVFMLTRPNKKIRSGAMTRREAYDKIVSLGLQNMCKETLGRNYTVCKTEDLEKLINENTEAEVAPATNALNIGDAFEQLLEVLSDEGVISNTEKQGVINTLYGKEAAEDIEDMAEELESSYSDDDIDEMFDFD